jgi:hypothetical protein
LHHYKRRRSHCAEKSVHSRARKAAAIGRLRSNSQLIRSLVYKKWVNAASSLSFDDFYDKFSGAVMVNIDRIIDMAGL